VQHAVTGRLLADDEEEGEVGGVNARAGLGVQEGLGGVDLGRDTGFVVDGTAAGDEQLGAVKVGGSGGGGGVWVGACGVGDPVRQEGRDSVDVRC
jgi:hypothetical protein